MKGPKCTLDFVGHIGTASCRSVPIILYVRAIVVGVGAEIFKNRFIRLDFMVPLESDNAHDLGL